LLVSWQNREQGQKPGSGIRFNQQPTTNNQQPLFMDAIFFYFFALLVLGGAILTITRRSAIHSAICLIVSLVGVAGLYLLQKAEFLFAVQIILYIGGIMVLFLFVIMLVNLDEQAKERQFNGQWWVALACVAVVAAQLFFFVNKGSAAFQLAKPVEMATDAAKGNTEMLADVLFSEYLLPFEIASILLLVAVVGSVVMAKKRI
jgi:NADH-quinone oxidoreductase subunit J